MEWAQILLESAPFLCLDLVIFLPLELVYEKLFSARFVVAVFFLKLGQGQFQPQAQEPSQR